MITNELLNPKSIVVVGASNDIKKPGGRVLKNLIDGNYKGQIYAINPKEDIVQGINCLKTVQELPNVDLAIIAIAAKYTPETVNELANNKSTKGFIILSAGFSEESEQGKQFELEIVNTINKVGGSLIGPNCIGFLNPNYNGVFTTPIPKLDSKGCDFISGSGATAVFIMEAAIPKGIKFASVYSVGNSAQMGVEDVLKYLDESYEPETSSNIKLLYFETLNKPELLLKHATSLIRKGCKIAAIKSGTSEAGSRAASSHTGALASPDTAIDAILKKAGIVRCYGREELTTVAAIFMLNEIKGDNIAIITHAGGPAVMMTDALSHGGFKIPHIEGDSAQELLTKLYPGSSVGNPIDFLATGNAQQLDTIIDYCENKFDNIDAMAIIFGSPGLFEVYDVYKVIDEKMKICKKPIFPIMPSIINVKNEIEYFLAQGRVTFSDEVVFANCLSKIHNTPKPTSDIVSLPVINHNIIRKTIDSVQNGYLSAENIQVLLNAAGIPRAAEIVVADKKAAVQAAEHLGYPIVMKVIGPLHKSDAGGVFLNIKSSETVESNFDSLMSIPNACGVLIQKMHSGTELFIGAKYEKNFGHLILCGLGGIYIEVLKDVATGLSPLTKEEAKNMIHSLKTYKIFKGVRGQEGINEDKFIDIILRVSALLNSAPEIMEMDLNPLLAKGNDIIAVDARIRIDK